MDSEIKCHRYTFKKDISFWIYVKIRYENFHYSVIVDSMKKDCVLLEKLRKLQRVVHVLCALCALGFEKDGKVRKLEWYITQQSIPVWVLTSRHTEYEYDVSAHAGSTFRQTLLRSIHLPLLGRIYTIGCYQLWCY